MGPPACYPTPRLQVAGLSLRDLLGEHGTLILTVCPTPTGIPPCHMPQAAALLRSAACLLDRDSLLAAFGGEEGSRAMRHPKMAALRERLVAFAGRESYHGIVFVRARTTARRLAACLEAAPGVAGAFQVSMLVGHGGSEARVGLKGMSS